MAAVFEFSESNDAGETVTNSVSNYNFGNQDATNLSAPNNQVIAGLNSFEKWIRGRFSGAFTTISNVRWFKSSGSLPANVVIKAAADASYATPTDNTSIVALIDVPVTEGAALTPVAPAGNPDFTGYITMQLQAGVAAASGPIPTQTFTMKYDEV